jgi:putative transferase (TIGR04331 family)
VLKESRFLITTADERTWKYDRPVLFLGEWCKRYERTHIWSGLNSIVAKPYGTSLSQKELDLFRARAMEKEIFPEVCLILNKHHNLNESERYWKIILGHWFRRHIELTINRVSTLMQCTAEYKITGTSFFSGGEYNLSTLTSAEAYTASQDDIWNNLLLKKMHTINPFEDLKVDLVDAEVGLSFTLNGERNKYPRTKKDLQIDLFGIIGRKFIKNSDAMIMNSYLHPKSELLLQVAIRQFPQLNRSSPYYTLKSHDRVIRTELSRQLESDKVDVIENMVRSLTFENMPICYLEGFRQLLELAEAQNWPKKPKIVFTSNNFDTDEVFKTWVANKIKSGTSYIVGQHGNGYGTHRFFDPTVEEETSDHFLTWGWGEELDNHEPAFIFSHDQGNMGLPSKTGGLLLMQSTSVVRLQTWDETAEFLDSLNEEKIFVANLLPMVRDKLILKPHPASRHQNHNSVLPLEVLYPEIGRPAENSLIGKLIPMSRLVVYSYDSTGMLKTLAGNIPTMAFWQNRFDHLLDSAIPYYNLLVDVGIIHLTPESAALKINEVWGDVESWWNSREVQSARELFCSRYARTSDKPIRDLKKILLRYL